MEADTAQITPLVSTIEPISRPSSTSTSASAPVLPPALPPIPTALSILSAATENSAADSSPQRAIGTPLPAMPGVSAPSTAGPGGSQVTSCHNCGTQTTPLWRRDEAGSILCNACGLFLKLHGRPRPISLKTDVIKSRNRVKTMRPDMPKPKKNAVGMNGAEHNSTNGGDLSGQRRSSQQRTSNGHVDENHSPISRTGTPNLYQPHPALPLYHGLDDAQFQAQGLSGFGVPGASPGRAASPMNGERLDLPQTNESILAANASLKTRVSELEVIQELYRSRLAELEQGEAQSRQAQEISGKTEVDLRSRLDMVTDSEAQLRKELEDSHRRENMLKRRLDEMEAELKDTKEALEAHRDGRAKKVRLDTTTDTIKAEGDEEPGPTASA